MARPRLTCTVLLFVIFQGLHIKKSSAFANNLQYSINPSLCRVDPKCLLDGEVCKIGANLGAITCCSDFCVQQPNEETGICKPRYCSANDATCVFGDLSSSCDSFEKSFVGVLLICLWRIAVL